MVMVDKEIKINRTLIAGGISIIGADTLLGEFYDGYDIDFINNSVRFKSMFLLSRWFVKNGDIIAYVTWRDS